MEGEIDVAADDHCGNHGPSLGTGPASPVRAGRSVGAATSPAAPERVRWPRLAAEPTSGLRGLLQRGYAGFTEATTPREVRDSPVGES